MQPVALGQFIQCITLLERFQHHLRLEGSTALAVNLFMVSFRNELTATYPDSPDHHAPDLGEAYTNARPETVDRHSAQSGGTSVNRPETHSGGTVPPHHPPRAPLYASSLTPCVASGVLC
jgi:hypothetical protein